VVIELLSESTAVHDKTTKKVIYENSLRVPEYFWFDPFSSEWAGFILQHGKYEAIAEDSQGRLVSQGLDLALVRWQGVYQEMEAHWLRWSTLSGALLPTPQEVAAEAQHQVAEAQHQVAEARRQAAEAQHQADAMAALLNRYRERFGELQE
jgi:hypothetical protein